MRPSTALGWYLFSIISCSPFGGVESPAAWTVNATSLSTASSIRTCQLRSTSAASLPRQTPTRAIMLLAVAGFASQAQVRVTDSLLPQIAGDFHTTVGAAAMVVTAYAVAHGSIQLVIGPFGDRLGKYRTVALMCAIGTVLVALCGMASSLPQLALARLATGAAAGWIIPISMAYVGDVTPYERAPADPGALPHRPNSRPAVRPGRRRRARRSGRLAQRVLRALRHVRGGDRRPRLSSSSPIR